MPQVDQIKAEAVTGPSDGTDDFVVSDTGPRLERQPQVGRARGHMFAVVATRFSKRSKGSIRRLRTIFVCALLIAMTSPQSAVAAEPTTSTQLEAMAVWWYENPTQVGDQFVQTIIDLRRETTASGELSDFIVYSEATFVAIDNGFGGITLVVAELVVAGASFGPDLFGVTRQAHPVGTIQIDPGLRRFAIDQTLTAQHCIFTAPNYFPPTSCSAAGTRHVVGVFERLPFWSVTAGKYPGQPGEIVTVVEKRSNGTVILTVDGAPPAGTCGDIPEHCGIFAWASGRVI